MNLDSAVEALYRETELPWWRWWLWPSERRRLYHLTNATRWGVIRQQIVAMATPTTPGED